MLKDKATFNIADYGALGDGKTLNTKAIQAALDACKEGGGTVHVPKGRYLTGTVRMWDNTTLYLEQGAVLVGSDNLADYTVGVPSHQTPDISWEAVIFAQDAKSICIMGEGELNGQGHMFPLGAEAQSMNDTQESEERIRPSIIFFKACDGIRLEGVHIENAAQFATLFEDCRGMEVEGISIHNRQNQNTDGLHFSGCSDVHITGCKLDCGDDAIVFNKQAEGCSVSNCDISSRWAGIRVGPFSSGDLKNIRVSDCFIHDTYGCAVKIQTGEGGTTSNLLFENLKMQRVTGPIHISLTHFSGWRVLKEGDFFPGAIKGVVIRNVQADTVECAMPSPIEVPPYPGEKYTCMSIMGVEGFPVQDITLENIDICYAGGAQPGAWEEEVPVNDYCYPEYFRWGVLPAFGLFGRNVRGLKMKNVALRAKKPDARYGMVLESAQDVRQDNCRVENGPNT